MKKYIIPIASSDVDLSRIKFVDPLSCKIDNNKINLTYKTYMDPNTNKTIKNKLGINFNGEIVKKENDINLIGDFHYSKKLIILWIISIILIELFMYYIFLADFPKIWVLDMSILMSLFFYNNLVNGNEEKFIIISLLTKEINKVSSKKFDYTYLYNEKSDYYDLNELYKDVQVPSNIEKRNKYIQDICCLISIVLFLSGIIGTVVCGIQTTTKKFEIVNDYSPLYEKEDFGVDENNRLYVVCTNYTEIFDKNGNFLMKVNHGRGVSRVYLNFQDGLTGFLVSTKGEEGYHEFVVDVSNKKILKENKYKDEEIYIENLNGSRYYERHNKLYTIRGDKVSIKGDNVNKVLDLNSPKTPIFWGYLFSISFIGVAMLYFVKLKFR